MVPEREHSADHFHPDPSGDPWALPKALAIRLGRRLDRVAPGFVSWAAERFPFRRNGPPPWTPMRAPLPSARVALLTTSGLYLEGQAPFHMGRLLGDASYRAIPADAGEARLLLSAVEYDGEAIEADPNVALPLRALEELAAEGRVGGATPHHYGLLGYVLETQPLLERTAPALVGHLREEGADALVLLPACIVCNQTVSLLARFVEGAGIPTVCLLQSRRAAERCRPPRALVRPFPCGRPLGGAGDGEGQKAFLGRLLSLLGELPAPGFREEEAPATSVHRTGEAASCPACGRSTERQAR
ncbi:MAG: hypothetical protein ACE5JJ_10120 [Nitrospinota bacterium]